MMRLFVLFTALVVLTSGCSYLSSLGGKTDETSKSQDGYMKPDSATPGKLAYDPMSLGPSVFAQYSANDESSSSTISDLSPASKFGYRVQLGAFIDQSLAEKLASRAESELGHKAYVVFDRPFYRVRVGNFKDISEAEMLKSNAITKGYQDARIARDEIEVSGE